MNSQITQYYQLCALTAPREAVTQFDIPTAEEKKRFYMTIDGKLVPQDTVVSFGGGNTGGGNATIIGL